MTFSGVSPVFLSLELGIFWKQTLQWPRILWGWLSHHHIPLHASPAVAGGLCSSGCSCTADAVHPLLHQNNPHAAPINRLGETRCWDLIASSGYGQPKANCCSTRPCAGSWLSDARDVAFNEERGGKLVGLRPPPVNSCAQALPGGQVGPSLQGLRSSAEGPSWAVLSPELLCSRRAPPALHGDCHSSVKAPGAEAKGSPNSPAEKQL